jgi:hypothetical protein
MNYGFIYCLGNECMPGIYKIGMTDRAPSQRCFELSSSTSAPKPFDLLCFGEVHNALSVERELHDIFAGARLNKSREFFSADYREIREVFNALSDHLCETPAGKEHSHSLELMQTFYLAQSQDEKIKALLNAAQFSGIRLWSDQGVVRTSARLAYTHWLTAAISGMRNALLEVLPTKQPVNHLMALVCAMEKSE